MVVSHACTCQINKQSGFNTMNFVKCQVVVLYTNVLKARLNAFASLGNTSLTVRSLCTSPINVW